MKANRGFTLIELVVVIVVIAVLAVMVSEFIVSPCRTWLLTQTRPGTARQTGDVQD